MMLSVYHTLFQHYALMFLQELQFTGGKRCFCSYLALRDSVGQWICPYISRHLLSLNPLLACCRRYSRGER
ncbi:hypothetical protein C5P23_25340 [Escherichia coli]|nr:hypothetical protein C5P23_25340 [Escherichia coli]